MNIQTIMTHDGIFHADEVFGCAVLKLINKDINIVRTRDSSILEGGQEDQNTILIDVGGKYDTSRLLYDHHQKEGSGQRENGVQYSSFGLVWKHYGHLLIATLHPKLTEQQNNDVHQILDDGLVSSVDVVDCNGLQIYKDTNAPIFTVSQVISGFNTFPEERFALAWAFAMVILQNELESAVNRVLKQDRLKMDMQNQEGVSVLVISEFFPGWQAIVTGSNFQRVVFQDVSGTWRIQNVPENSSLPEAWCGLNGEKLDAVTGVKGGIFCHRAGFIAGHDNFEGAMEMAYKSIL